MINSLKLKQVITVAQSGSISKAAAALNITQSTITKAVAEVEQDLGYPLFDRKSRGVAPTEQGREFLNRASRIVSDLDLLIEDIRDQKNQTETLLRIGVTPASLEGLLNRAIANLIAKNPSVRVHLSSMKVSRGIRLLRRGDLDLIFGPADELSNQDDFEIEMISTMQSSLFCRKDHPLLKRKKLRIEDILAYKLIAPSPENRYAEQVHALAIAANIDPMRHFHVIENFNIVADVVSKTDSIAVTSNSYVNTSAFKARFKKIEMDIFEPFTMAAAYRRRWEPSKYMRECIEEFKAYPPGG
ncbi:MAG: LysR family transcriptional regulator [Pseudomonadales bacterium]|nr:LysR family transcriptional regulator [Pseudomonadales bacterium]